MTLLISERGLSLAGSQTQNRNHSRIRGKLARLSLQGATSKTGCKRRLRSYANIQDSQNRRLALAVRVDGIQYVGEYNLASANGYVPGEFTSGDPVPVRFVGTKMLVERPNGKVLETNIAKKVGGTSPPTCTA